MRAFGVIGACVLVCACQQPKWLDPAASRGTAELAPAVVEILSARDATGRSMVKPAGGETPDAPPPPPTWAVGLIGKSLQSFPRRADCIVAPDYVQLRFLGGGGGSRIVGWGWLPAARTPVPRLLAVDSAYRIVGFGESGVRRLDVRAVRPDVTSDLSGWSVITPRTAGAVDIYGLLDDGQTVCKGGHLEL